MTNPIDSMRLIMYKWTPKQQFSHVWKIFRCYILPHLGSFSCLIYDRNSFIVAVCIMLLD